MPRMSDDETDTLEGAQIDKERITKIVNKRDIHPVPVRNVQASISTPLPTRWMWPALWTRWLRRVVVLLKSFMLVQRHHGT